MVDILSRHEAELAHTTIQLTRAEARQQDNVEQVGNFAQEKTELEAGEYILNDTSGNNCLTYRQKSRFSVLLHLQVRNKSIG